MNVGRLATDDPEYRYPASTNPYWKKLRSFPLVHLDQATEAHRGNWRNQFLNPSSEGELHVEIGCNAGHVLLEWAARNTNHHYLGIDWKFKAIHRASEKAQKKGLKNIQFLRMHAERLSYVFGPKEVTSFSIFFPDPWPKTAHWKHRWITGERLKQMAALTRDGGEIYIKTDHPGYYRWILKAALEAQEHWEILEQSADLHKDCPDPLQLKIPEVTLFEKIFIKQNLPIHAVRLRKTT